MTFAAQEPRGRIKPDPAGARQIDFGPGVQVGEIFRSAGRAVERLDVGPQLDEIAGHEPRRQAEMAQELHQEPGGVAARSGAAA